MIIMNTVAISDFRSNLPSLINQVSQKLTRFTITVSGKPKAIVISPEELESLEETAQILSIPGALKTIKKSQKQIREGKYITLEEFEKKHL